MTMKRKLSPTKVWERDHPGDEPCPRGRRRTIWLRERGLDLQHTVTWLSTRIGADTDPWIQNQIRKLEGRV